MPMKLHRLVLVLVSLCSIVVTAYSQTTESRVRVSIITDEADAVLRILHKKSSNQPVVDEDWQRLFSSEGYVRLKRREAAMKRAFEDADFKTFVLSDALAARARQLEETLNGWRTLDVTAVGTHVLAYLPANSHIAAKIYPEIKPRENSFVFDLNTDPAIFLFIDPKVTKEKFENTLAHELHHIGYGTACPTQAVAEASKKLPQKVQNILDWMGAFGEGFAMLAAAGGPKVHPHAMSLPEDRARWDKDVANFNNDLKLVEKFFLDVLDDKLTEEQRTNAAREFYGTQGPWYTVGWKMAVTIEEGFGRKKLIEVMCDQRQLLATYNAAALKRNKRTAEKLPTWSDRLVQALRA